MHRLTPRSAYLPLLLGGVLIATSGCPTRPVSELEPNPEIEIRKEVSLGNRNVDILFVIDNSGSMADEQANLVANFSKFMDKLRNIRDDKDPTGVSLPNIHIGVITSDVGLDGFNVGGQCSGAGDDGILRRPTDGTCPVPTDAFISSIKNADGTRSNNYDDQMYSLEQVFTCLADMKVTAENQGCGLERHFEAMKRALLPDKNPGFLRPNAYLAVIFLADEDDCSAQLPDASMPLNGQQHIYNPNPEFNDELGPFGSFRCTEWGVWCDDAAIDRNADNATYTSCAARDDAHASRLQHPREFVKFLEEVKGDPNLVISAAIVGNLDPFQVKWQVPMGGTTAVPMLLPSCKTTEGDEGAAPGARFSTFIQDLGRRGSFQSICEPDLSGPLVEIAALLEQVIGTPCLEKEIDTSDLDPAQPGLQINCQVSDAQNVGQPNETATVIPRCTMLGEDMPDTSTAPCWWTRPNGAACLDDTSGLELVIERNGAEPPPGTRIVARCTPATEGT